MKFYVETFGCKVNAYESNFVIKSLEDNGFVLVNDINNANIIIVNTCTVTNTADSKCKKFIRRVKREYSNAILCVMGCSSQNNFSLYQDMKIDILLGNNEKSKIAEIINEYLSTNKSYEYYSNNRDLEFESMEINDFNHTRAFLKIQDGCDNFCSYCIIPFVRGKCRSKSFSDVILEAKNLVKNNHKEIVLTGIHTGSYNDNGKDLVDVINELSKIEGLLRIRLSSVEVTELNDKFMDMLKNNPKFCNHLHIPLQAGSDNVLKKMNRKYDMKYFFDKINLIRSIRNDISITTDIIVGFPEETSEDFQNTLDNSRKLKFSKIHVFPYSKRNGTVASKMKDVEDNVKSLRVHKLLELSSELECEYENEFNGTMQDVLIEEVNDKCSIGHTSNYLKVVVPEVLEKNTLVNVLYDKDNLK